MADDVLFITLDSCRYDTFVSATAPNIKAVGELWKAQSPSYFTYPSHLAFFVGALLRRFQNGTIVICADHGENWGEDGLWGHTVNHPTVLEVPLIIRSNQ